MPVEFDKTYVLRIKAATMRGVVRGTEMLRSEMVRLILETQKSGRTYRRRGVSHIASAPGEPPASDRGFLINSIRTTYRPREFVGVVSVNAKYGMLLEYGTQRMEPRPFMRPAVANMSDKINQVINEEIERAR